jgi:tetratricopeptide (TPR) repeat protein
MGSLVGAQHNTLLDWLATGWRTEGPRVCVIEGFPGVGKTRVAEDLSDRLAAAADPPLIVRTVCPSSQTGLIDDLLLNLAQEFAEAGEPSLADRLDVPTLHQLLARRVLLIIDEFQNSFHDRPGHPPRALARLLEDIAGRSQPGRVLLLTSRDVERARWTDRCAVRTLAGLAVDDGQELLAQMLRDEDLGDAVPDDRRRDVVKWLGGYPRALRLLVSRLRYEALDDLIGLEPEAWEDRDRTVSAALLRRIEEVLVSRAQEGLPDAARHFLRRLAVYRRPADMQALRAITEHGTDVEELRNEMIARFLIEHRRGLYAMHPVLRDTILVGLEGPAKVQAHRAAGDHYARHFRAKQTVGSPAKLGGAFVEARYHFTQAGQRDAFAEIARLFEQHVRKTMGWTTPVPEDPDELEERITLLSALLHGDGAKGLHYYLARLLSKRARPGDALRALHHAERGTGRQSPADAWVLRIRLVAEQNGPDRALVVAREGIRFIPPEQNLFALYQNAAEMLGRAGRVDEAVALLEEGIKRVPPDKALFALYQEAAIISLHAGLYQDSIFWYHRGLKELPATSWGRHKLAIQALFSSSAEADQESIERTLELYRVGNRDDQVIPLGKVLGLEVAGHWRAAAEAAEAALAVRPNSIDFAR